MDAPSQDSLLRMDVQTQQNMYYGSGDMGAPATQRRGPWNRGARSSSNSQLKKHCNCKNSRCLKLYCECFASGRYCDNCNCVNCCNNKDNESTRKAAVEAILERNPNAFRPKIQGGTNEDGLATSSSARHNKGCNCKKSGCLKKYCECFQAGIYCSDNCKCLDCKNFDGSELREALMAHHQQAQAASAGLAPGLALTEPPLRAASPAARSGGRRSGSALGDRSRRGPAAVQSSRSAAPSTSGSTPAGGAASAAPMMPPLQAPLQRGMGSPEPSGRGSALGGPHAAGMGGAVVAPTQVLLQPPPQLVLPPAPPRQVVREVINEIAKKGGVEHLCQLLLLVSQEQPGDEGASRDEARPGQASQQQAQPRGSGPAENGAAVAGETPAREPTANGEAGGGDADMPDAHEGMAAGGPAGERDGAGASTSAARSTQYGAQEAAVLREFHVLLQKMRGAVDKKLAAGGGLLQLPQGLGPMHAGQQMLVPLQHLGGDASGRLLQLAPALPAGQAGGEGSAPAGLQPLVLPQGMSLAPGAALGGGAASLQQLLAGAGMAQPDGGMADGSGQGQAQPQVLQLPSMGEAAGGAAGGALQGQPMALGPVPQQFVYLAPAGQEVPQDRAIEAFGSGPLQPLQPPLQQSSAAEPTGSGLQSMVS